MIKLLKQFRPIYWFILALLVVIIYGQVQFELGLADKMGDITALIQKHASTSEIWKVGKTMLLTQLANAITKNHKEVYLIFLLIDEGKIYPLVILWSLQYFKSSRLKS